MEATPGTSKAKAILAALRENPHRPVQELMAEFGCSRALVRNAQARIKRDQVKARQTEEALRSMPVTVLPGEEPANEEERVLLAWFYSDKVPVKDRLAAHSRLTELRNARAESAAGSQLGPKPPVSESEVVRRLADLLEGVGRRFAKLAWSEAFYKRPRIGVRRPCPENNGSAEPSASSDPSSDAVATPSPAVSASEPPTSDPMSSPAAANTSPEKPSTTGGESPSPSTSASAQAATPSVRYSTSASTPQSAPSPPVKTDMASASGSSPVPSASPVESTTASPTPPATASSTSSPPSSPASGLILPEISDATSPDQV